MTGKKVNIKTNTKRLMIIYTLESKHPSLLFLAI